MISIKDKFDFSSVEKIIELGYPKNINYLDELLSWTCDPNWPIAGSIYQYFIKLGRKEVKRVLSLAEKADIDWRYTIIIQILSSYDDLALKECVDHLKSWAAETGSEECDIESIRILSERELISVQEVFDIVKRNLFVYNLWIKETLNAADKSIYSLPMREHKL